MKGYYDNMGGYTPTADFHLSQTDSEVFSAIRLAARDAASPGHLSAKAICGRGHFRLVYSRNPSDETRLNKAIESDSLRPDLDQPISPAYYIWKALINAFSPDLIKIDLRIPSTSDQNSFPVLMNDGRIEDSTKVSSIVAKIPGNIIDYLFAYPDIADDVRDWIAQNRERILDGGLQ